MNCCRCGKSVSDLMAAGKSMFPIEPKGTPNRKWSCTDCAIGDEMPMDDIAGLFDPAFSKDRYKIKEEKII